MDYSYLSITGRCYEIQQRPNILEMCRLSSHAVCLWFWYPVQGWLEPDGFLKFFSALWVIEAHLFFSSSRLQGQAAQRACSPHSEMWFSLQMCPRLGVVMQILVSNSQQRISPKRRLRAGYPCRHLAKNFGQAL